MEKVRELRIGCAMALESVYQRERSNCAWKGRVLIILEAGRRVPEVDWYAGPPMQRIVLAANKGKVDRNVVKAEISANDNGSLHGKRSDQLVSIRAAPHQDVVRTQGYCSFDANTA